MGMNLVLLASLRFSVEFRFGETWAAVRLVAWSPLGVYLEGDWLSSPRVPS
jgi:hypothetical protein